MNDAELIKAEKYIINSDPILGAIIKRQTIKPKAKDQNYFASLCKSIISQQISVAAAKSIHTKFVERTNENPYTITRLSIDEIKKVGLSKQKASYIKDISKHFIDNPDIYNHLETQNDEQIIKELTEIKGIGIWTAQIFLMSTLGRPNIFAPDDIGLQRAMAKVYKWKKMPPKKDLEKLADKWSPYKSVACRHLWTYLDNNPLNV